jgi:hypothetical protein
MTARGTARPHDLSIDLRARYSPSATHNQDNADLNRVAGSNLPCEVVVECPAQTRAGNRGGAEQVGIPGSRLIRHRDGTRDDQKGAAASIRFSCSR